MKFLLVFVVAIIIVNFGYASRSPAYCIKKVLRPRDLYVNGFKTTKYESKILRVCCEGYTQYRRRCVPLCEELCINSICTAPNTCSCKKGFTKLNDHRCAPVCDNCKYGFCVAPGVCVCYKGYVKDNSTEVCSPVCSQPCTNGYCSDPDFCTCYEGYKISTQDKYTCERNYSLDTTTIETTQDNTTPFAAESTMITEFDDISSTLLSKINTETDGKTIQSEASSISFEPSSATSTTSKSTFSPSVPIMTSTQILHIPKRRSKALQDIVLFAHPPVSYNSLKETTKHVIDTSPDVEDSSEPSSRTSSSDWISETTDRKTTTDSGYYNSLKETTQQVISTILDVQDSSEILSKTSSSDWVSETTDSEFTSSETKNTDTTDSRATDSGSIYNAVTENKLKDMLSKLLSVRALEQELEITFTPTLKRSESFEINQETTDKIFTESSKQPPVDIQTSQFDQFRELSSTTVTSEYETPTENLHERNRNLQRDQNEIFVKEVQSSKILSKKVLLTVYGLLAMLAIIGMYVLLWFICSCKRLHEKEYNIARLGMEKKKGVVKYSADRNDVITAW